MFCLTPKEKDSIQALRDKDPAWDTKLIWNVKEDRMTTSDERREMLSILGEDRAIKFNERIESQFMKPRQDLALTKLLDTMLDKKAPEYRDMVTRILKNSRLMNPKDVNYEGFLKDLIASKFHNELTQEQSNTIFDKARELNEIREAGDKTPLRGVTDEYLKGRRELATYIESLKPITPLESLWGNIAKVARNNLISNLSTPIKATISQLQNTMLDYFTRRASDVATGNFGKQSLIDSKLQKQAEAESSNLFWKVGINDTIMENPDDFHVLNKGEHFEVQSKALPNTPAGRFAKAFNWLSQKWNTLVIDYMHNKTFTMAYQKTFFDSVNVYASDMARLEGADTNRANELFKDAVRIVPNTPEGSMIRAEAQKQAARITMTNKTMAADLIQGLQRGLNNNFLKIPVGDAIIPMARIPTNVIMNAIENSGVGLVRGGVEGYQGWKKLNSDDINVKREGLLEIKSGFQRLARNVTTLGAAYLLSSQFTKSDFKEDKYGNSFFKVSIGSKELWINTEYLNFVSPALAGMMHVKEGKWGNSPLDRVEQYMSGALSPLQRLPAVEEVPKLFQSIANTNVVKGIQKYAKDLVSSRGWPRLFDSVGKILEGSDRGFEQLLFGKQGVETEQQREEDRYRR